MIHKLLLCTFLFLTTSYLYGQKIAGKIIDTSTQKPIGFVNVGVLEHTNGAVSSEDGFFELELKEKDKTVRFSSIGYKSKTFSTEELVKMDIVYLEPVIYGIELVKINSKKFSKRKKIGKKIRTNINTISWGNSEFTGLEIGVPIKIKKESLLKSAHFGILKSSTPNTRLRINIYDFKNGQVGKNLMPENVFVYSKDLLKYGKVDLSHLNLVVKDDILLSIETIEQSEVDTFYLVFGGTLSLKGNIYSRDASQATFRKGQIENMLNIGAYLNVKQVK